MSTGRAALQPLLVKFRLVFDADLTGCTGLPVNPEQLEGATPKLLKALSVPFAPRSAVEAQLDRLEKQGILEPTKHSHRTTFLLLARKRNGQLDLCGDYRSSVNTAFQKTAYALHTAEEAFSQLQEGEVLSTLDLTEPYQQHPVTPETATVLTVDTLKDLYKVRCLPFSVFAAPAMIQ